MPIIDQCVSATGALASADPLGLYVEVLEPYSYMMNVDEVAEFLGQTPQAVTRYLRLGIMKGVKVGRNWRVPKKYLIEYLYSNLNVER